MRPTLVVMLKEPRPGRVKTRLGRDIGMVAAAWWFRHQVRRLLREVEDPRWHLVLAVAPDRSAAVSRVWPAHITRIPSGRRIIGCTHGTGDARMPARAGLYHWRRYSGCPQGAYCARFCNAWFT